MMKVPLYSILIVAIWLAACSLFSKQKTIKPVKAIQPVKTNQQINLDLAQANRLANLPLTCIQQPLPYKSGLVIAKPSDLVMPVEHHPAFYGCFDWHSAVHGHWSLVYLLKTFPALEKQLYENIQPLANYISNAYVEYLPKLVYPIRVGEHTNTAFGLSFAYDYALTLKDTTLQNSIESNALRFYQNDKGCPISWEPSGYDFLSPCLQEVDIMRKVLDEAAFEIWFASFLPELISFKK